MQWVDLMTLPHPRASSLRRKEGKQLPDERLISDLMVSYSKEKRSPPPRVYG